jgi:hypothetical protein
MANSYLNIATFIGTTLFYYLAIKPELTYDKIKDQSQYAQYVNSNYMFLGIYLLLVIIVQFIANTSIITNNCGGNITENIGAGGVLTFIPWLIMFGGIITSLIIYPGLKSVFSDVIGYYCVSSSANKLLTELLVDQKVENQMKAENLSSDEKEALQSTADTIIKICGNTSILINQIVPSNFNSYWEVLVPLMKDKYKTENNETTEKRIELFNLVVLRDKIGEAMWYIYTGILISSFVQLKISQRGCVNNPKKMEENYQKFLDAQKTAQEKKDLATSTEYQLV